MFFLTLRIVERMIDFIKEEDSVEEKKKDSNKPLLIGNMFLEVEKSDKVVRLLSLHDKQNSMEESNVKAMRKAQMQSLIVSFSRYLDGLNEFCFIERKKEGIASIGNNIIERWSGRDLVKTLGDVKEKRMIKEASLINAMLEFVSGEERKTDGMDVRNLKKNLLPMLAFLCSIELDSIVKAGVCLLMVDCFVSH